MPEGVQLTEWPTVDEQVQNEEICERWIKLLLIRQQVMGALERAKENGQIDQPLSAHVIICAPEKEFSLLASFADNLHEILVVSAAEIQEALDPAGGLSIQVSQATGERCERCWLRDSSIGTSAKHPTLCRRCAERVEVWPPVPDGTRPG